MCKFKQEKTTTQPLPAGVSPNDSNIEFVGEKKNRTVIWIQNGKVHPFADLPAEYYTKLREAYLSDKKAVDTLTSLGHSIRRCVELYTYYVYGDLDATPDFKDGELQPSENFRETLDCISLEWDSKCIDIQGAVITPRQLKILDLMAQGLPDKAIASQMGVELCTIDYHKNKLFKKLNVQSKPEALIQAIKSKVVRI